MTATVALLVIALPGLLAPGPGARTGPEMHVGMLGAEGPRADCRPLNRELRFEWIQAGDEPELAGSGNAAVCLAVYQVDRDR